MANQKISPTSLATSKTNTKSRKQAASSQLPIKFSTDISSPETKRKMLLFKKLLKMEMVRDAQTSREIQQSRLRRQRDEDMGKFSKYL